MKILTPFTSHAHTRSALSFVTNPVTSILGGAALSYVARATLSAPLLVAAQVVLLAGTRRASRRQLAIAFVATWLASYAAFRGAAHELTGGEVAFAIAMGIGALFGVVTLEIDRLLFARLPLGVSPLAYPALRTPIEVASALLGPYGAWGSMAALSAGSPVAAVTVPVAGMFGLSFLLSWFASALAAGAIGALRGRGRAASIALLPAVIAAGILTCLGAAARSSDGGPTVRVAAVALPDDATGRSARYASLLRDWRAHGGEAPDALDAEDDRSLATALRAIGEAADRGAKVVYVAETNVHVREERAGEVEAKLGALARSRRIWIGLGLGVTLRGGEPNLENEIVLVDPTGAVSARYEKTHAIGDETHAMVLGNGEVPVRDADGSRIAGIICFDSDFLGFARKVARQRVDILFAPSNDWKEIAEMRGALTRYRALETGATLVRPTSHGVSEIVAPDGRLLDVARYDDARGSTVIADVPAHGRATTYATAGDWPAALASLALLVALLAAGRRPAHRMEPWGEPAA